MPCDYKLYPPNWKQTRSRILERAKSKCEKCGLPNYAVGYRDSCGEFVPNAGNGPCDASGEGKAWPSYEPLTYQEAREFTEHYNDCGVGKRQTDADGNRWFVVVLTIAHLKDGPLDCPDSDLAALCQQCHLTLDKQKHINNRKRTAQQKKACGSLFEVNHA